VTLTRRAFLLAGAAAVLRPWAAFAQKNPLKITDVDPVLLPGGRLLVLVRTDQGISGVGEVSPMNARAAATLITTAFKPLLVGRNPLDIDRCWETVFFRTYKQGPSGLQPEALSGVDIALWDILGKVTELPIYQLLGGKRRDRVRVYASIGGASRQTPAQMARRAEAAVKRGFTAVKIRQDYGPVPPDVNPAKDLAVLREVRKTIGPDVELKYDVNNGYSVPTAIRIGREIGDPKLNVIHYEEPVAQTDYAGYAKVVDAVPVPVAAGEHEYTRWQFRDLIQQANPAILQPDLIKCAGITEAVKIAALISAHHKLLVPHQTSPHVGQAANLHYTSVFAAAESAQELAEGSLDSPQHALFKNPLEFKDGRLTVPTGPGLGLELDEAKLREMRVKE
jgi:L-alanine-DL-glutamate epimerase-like enolase superfamily enzyme